MKIEIRKEPNRDEMLLRIELECDAYSFLVPLENKHGANDKAYSKFYSRGVAINLRNMLDDYLKS
jgi:hypothetical protein